MSKRAANEISEEASNLSTAAAAKLSRTGASKHPSDDVDAPVVVIHDHINDDKSHSKKKGAAASNNGSRSKVFDPESSTLLDDMLYPLSREEFLNNHFRKNAVCIQRSNQHHKGKRDKNNGNSSRSRDGEDCNNIGNNEMVSLITEKYLFGLNIHQIFAETSSENVFLWLRPPADSSSPNTLNSVEISDPDTAYALHMSGSHPAYCRAPPLLEQLLVGTLLRATGLGGGHYHPPHSETVTLGGNTTLGRGEVELFIGAKSPDGNFANDNKTSTKKHITGHHTDFQENFTIQISGVKQWTLKRGRVSHPLRATTPHYCRDASVVENQLKVARLCLKGNDPSPEQGTYGFEYNDNNTYGEVQTITLYPGDVLYFPAGMWHTVKTVEPGLSLNVSLMGTTYATVVCEALQHLLVGTDERWREIVTSRPGDVDGSSRLQELMKGLSKTVEDFVTKGGGGHSVLPPALCYPQHNGPNDEELEIDESETKDKDDMSDGGSIVEGFQEVGSENEDEDGKEQTCLVVDMDSFIGPDGWSCKKPSGAKLVKNPLAVLLAKSEVTSHVLGDIDEDESTAKQFILNVNFAGNEMYESHIHVTFVTEEYVNLMETYLAPDYNAESDNQTPPDCLFYYGLFSWSG